MDVQFQVGQRIKKLRSLANISQMELALNANLDRTYINSVENGRRNISIQNIQKISNAFGINISNFFNSEEFYE